MKCYHHDWEYVPGVTVLGYPAGRKTAETVCRRVCQGFALNERLRRGALPVVARAIWGKVMI
jgi:hypothetical protein